MYVFVVLALAAFMAMFVVWRSPGITYQVQAGIVSAGIGATEPGDNPTRLAWQAREQLLDTDFILSALQQAGLIRGDTTPQMATIGAQIRQRLNVRLGETDDAKPTVQLALNTQHPRAAVQLLDCMTLQTEVVVKKGMLAVPAAVTSQRGGSLQYGQLTVLLILSCICGGAGVWLAERAKPTPILYSGQEIEEAVGLPVVVNLEDENTSPVLNPAASRRRFFRLVLTTAECGVAAVFLLIVFQLATQDAFLSRFFADPLAACGEALTRVMG